MYQIKGKKLDSTVATVKNLRKQRDLDEELMHIQEKWYEQLKDITRQKLDLLRDIGKFDMAKRRAHHFRGDVTSDELRNVVNTNRNSMQNDKEERLMKKWEFKPDPVDKLAFDLPAVDPDTAGYIMPPLRAINIKNNLSHLPMLKRWGSDPGLAKRTKSDNPFQSEQRVRTKHHSLPGSRNWDRWNANNMKFKERGDDCVKYSVPSLLPENIMFKKAQSENIPYSKKRPITLPPLKER